MTGGALKANSQGQKIDAYGDLFIYHLQGRVRAADELALGEQFLGNWVEDNTSFLFFSAPSREPVSELLRRRSDLELIDDYRLSYKQWQGEFPKPFRIGNFLFVPPWEKAEAEDEEIKIILDPGVVFGTGLHPTTRDCLRALNYLHRQYAFKKAVDLGTGTGILALAAAYLGAKQVLAVDLNPLCARTARKNVALNHLEKVIRVVEGRAEEFVDESADVLVANLHHGVVEKMLKMKAFREKAWLIISGLMRSQVRDVEWQMKEYGLEIIREWDHEMTWYTMLIENKCLK